MVPQEFDCSCLERTKKEVPPAAFQGRESPPQKTGEKQRKVIQLVGMFANQLFPNKNSHACSVLLGYMLLHIF